MARGENRKPTLPSKMYFYLVEHTLGGNTKMLGPYYKRQSMSSNQVILKLYTYHLDSNLNYVLK